MQMMQKHGEQNSSNTNKAVLEISFLSLNKKSRTQWFIIIFIFFFFYLFAYFLKR